MIKINLKYFKDSENNYIIYRKFSDNEPNMYMQSTLFMTREAILPTDNPTKIESMLDNLAKECLKIQLENFSNCQESDFSQIRIIGNFINTDETNPIFTKGILNKEDIDKSNTKYRFGIRIESQYPITINNFLKNPTLVIKTIVRDFIQRIKQCCE